MENKRGLYQEELCHIFSNYELPEYESSFVYKIVIRLLKDVENENAVGEKNER